MRLEAAVNFGEIDRALPLMDLHGISAAKRDVRASFTSEMDKVTVSASTTALPGLGGGNLGMLVGPDIERKQRAPELRRVYIGDKKLQRPVAAIEATRLTAEFRMPAVSQVSTMPRGESGKMQARQAVCPGTTFKVTA